MSILVGTIPLPIIESIRLEPPGLLTVTMTELFTGLDPKIVVPECPVKNVVAVGYESKTDPQGGFGKTTYTFMGGVTIVGGEGGDGEMATPNEVIELTIGVDQVPLGMHPNIAKILKMFGGTIKDNTLSFPEKDPTGQSKRIGVNALGEEYPLNPFFGVTSFFAPRATFRRRSLNEDGDIYALGKLDAPPLNNLPISGNGKNWIKTAVQRRQHGSATEATEEWLYAVNGWESKIYEYA